MAKTNNYFTVLIAGRCEYVTFDDSSERASRDAFVNVRRLIASAADGDAANVSLFRPIVWNLDVETGLVGRLGCIRHGVDPTVRGKMRIYCNLCGVSVVVRDLNAHQRDMQTETFEEAHAPHWIEAMEKREQAARVAAAKHALKKDDVKAR